MLYAGGLLGSAFELLPQSKARNDYQPWTHGIMPHMQGWMVVSQP
jgi:hypothetical protein